MGRDKGLLELGGVPLILHTARLLEPFVSDVTIVGSPRRYSALGLSAIEDDAYAQGRDRCGPLAGIATALAATNSRWNLIVACDLPYLSAEWIDWLLSRAVRSRGEPSFRKPSAGWNRWLPYIAANAVRRLRLHWRAACGRFPTPSSIVAWILCTRASGAGSIGAG
jgi:molybdopterin-guanine dinucleotide biosynthesis protein A